MIDNSWWEKFAQSMTAERLATYAETLKDRQSAKFNPTPVFFTAGQYKLLQDSTAALLTFLQSDRYQQAFYGKPWFLPALPLNRDDYIGAVDFFVKGMEIRLIEVNLSPPGWFTYVPKVHRCFGDIFPEWKQYLPPCTLHESLQDLLSRRFSGSRFAITVSHLKSSDRARKHYEFAERLIREWGYEVEVEFAKDLEVAPDGRPAFGGKAYDQIFNLLIIANWERYQEDFKSFSHYYTTHPQRFWPNPLNECLGYKDLLYRLYREPLPDYGLDQQQVGLIRAATLKAAPISDFSTVEQMQKHFNGKPLVLKANIGYGSEEVTIKPTAAELRAAMQDQASNYMVQEWYEAGRTPWIDANGIGDEWLGNRIRVYFMAGNIQYVSAYTFHLSSPLKNYYVNPVLVLPD